MSSPLGFRQIVCRAVVVRSACWGCIWDILVDDRTRGCGGCRIERAADGVEHDLAVAGRALHV